MDLWISVGLLTETKNWVDIRICVTSWWLKEASTRVWFSVICYGSSTTRPHFVFTSSEICASFWPQASAAHVQRAGRCKTLHPCYKCYGWLPTARPKLEIKDKFGPKRAPPMPWITHVDCPWVFVAGSCAKGCSCPLGDANSLGWGEPRHISSRETKTHRCWGKDCNLFQSSVVQWDDLGCVAAPWFNMEKFIHLLEIERILHCIQNNCKCFVCTQRWCKGYHSLLRLNSVNYLAWVRWQNLFVCK